MSVTPTFSLFDLVSAWVIVLDRAGLILHPNRACIDALGYPEDELRGLSLWDGLCDTPDRERARAAFTAFASGSPGDESAVASSFDAFVITKDGGRLFASWTFRRDASPGTAGTDVVVVTGIDRTAWKRVADELAWSERIVAASEDAIVSSTPSGTIRSWNPAAERIFGFSAEEAIGQPASIIYPEGNTQDRTNVIARMMRGEIVTEYDAPRRRKDGTVFSVAMTGALIRDGKGEVLGVLGIGRDITEAKRAQEAQAWLANIVNSSNDAIVSTDLDGVVRSWNPAAEQIYGYPAEEILGRTGEVLYPAERRAERDELLGALREGRAVTRETLRRRRDGILVPVLVTATPVRDRDGTVVGTSSIVRDLTERRQAEQDRAEHRRALRALATPVIRLWEAILLLPIIGEVDDARSSQLMDTLLDRVVEEHAKVVIIDVAGVPAMSTHVADMLLKLTHALRLLGARTVLTGLGSQASRTMIRLGIDLSQIVTQNQLADGVAVALSQLGKTVRARGS